MFKILHIIPNLRKGGAERLVLDICNALQRHEDVAVKLITFSEFNEYTFLTESVDWEVVPASVSLSVLGKNRLNVVKLQAAIEQFRPDVIHTHLFEAEIVSRSCHYPQARWFSHCHDNMVQFKNLSLLTFLNKTRLTNFFEKRYLLNRYKQNGGNQFIAISNDTLTYFKKTATQYPTHLLFNAIDFQRFYFPQEKKERTGKLRLINIGSFVEKKNQQFLIAVANELKKQQVDFELHFLGDGQLMAMVKQKANENDLEAYCHFHGNVNNVSEFLQLTDVYVHSATYEPLGLVLLEAMAAGLPVVTLDGRGNRDLIEHGKNGYMLYEQNAQLFAQTIEDLWSDKEIYQQMATYAQEYARQFDMHQYVKQLLVLYGQAIV